MKKEASYKAIYLTFGILVICLAIASYAIAQWTEPTSTPPGDNVSTPLNVSNVGQSKAGGLILNTGGATNGLIVDQGNVGIGTTEPSEKLHVVGSIRVDSESDICIEGGTCLSDSPAEFSPDLYNGEESITFPNGLIMKHGKVVEAVFGVTIVAFETPFPNAAISAQVIPEFSFSGFIARDSRVRSLSNTEVQIEYYHAVVGVKPNYYWQVWGY